MDLSSIGLKLASLLFKERHKLSVSVRRPSPLTNLNYVVNIVVHFDDEIEMSSGIDRSFSVALIKSIAEAGEIIIVRNLRIIPEAIAGGFFKNSAIKRSIDESYERATLEWHINESIPFLKTFSNLQASDYFLGRLATNTHNSFYIGINKTPGEFDYCCSVGDELISVNRIITTLNLSKINKRKLNKQSDIKRLLDFTSVIASESLIDKDVWYDYSTHLGKIQINKLSSPVRFMTYYSVN